MSSLVTEEHWSSCLGNMPMPEGATVEMMWAARDAIDDMESKDSAIRMMTWYSDSKVNYTEKKRLLQANDPDYLEKLKLYDNILSQIDEGIELLREQIND